MGGSQSQPTAVPVLAGFDTLSVDDYKISVYMRKTLENGAWNPSCKEELVEKARKDRRLDASQFSTALTSSYANISGV
jgi:hypothetical protein